MTAELQLRFTKRPHLRTAAFAGVWAKPLLGWELLA